MFRTSDFIIASCHDFLVKIQGYSTIIKTMAITNETCSAGEVVKTILFQRRLQLLRKLLRKTERNWRIKAQKQSLSIQIYQWVFFVARH